MGPGALPRRRPPGPAPSDRDEAAPHAPAVRARAGTALGDAIRTAPWAIDGAGRANTVVIERTGLVAKLGAEGVLVLVTADGHAVAVKTLDGAHRATTPVGLELLVREGLLRREIADDTIAAIADPFTTLRVAF